MAHKKSVGSQCEPTDFFMRHLTTPLSHGHYAIITMRLQCKRNVITPQTQNLYGAITTP